MFFPYIVTADRARKLLITSTLSFISIIYIIYPLPPPFCFLPPSQPQAYRLVGLQLYSYWAMSCVRRSFADTAQLCLWVSLERYSTTSSAISKTLVSLTGSCNTAGYAHVHCLQRHRYMHCMVSTLHYKHLHMCMACTLALTITQQVYIQFHSL